MFAEWEQQKGIVLIYPHKFCDFAPTLDDVQECYDTIISEVLKIEDVFLIMHPDDKKAQKHVQELLQNLVALQHTCHCIEIETNDVWARDCIAISVKREGTQQSVVANAVLREFVNFGFNGWGLKYPANLDNQINNTLEKLGFFSNMKTNGMILEGGSIDSNGEGLLLTTSQCLLESNRNPHLTKKQIEKNLKQNLSVSNVLWLNHGFLEGDNTTDGHIDTLARFITKDTIAYVQCKDSTNSHFRELHAMEKELEGFAKQYKLQLVALPLCIIEEASDNSSHISTTQSTQQDANLDSNAKTQKIKTRYLPASYINFLFLNNKQLLVPIYQRPTDVVALQALQDALPDYNITSINCRALITQEGSLHCASMQIH